MRETRKWDRMVTDQWRGEKEEETRSFYVWQGRKRSWDDEGRTKR